MFLIYFKKLITYCKNSSKSSFLKLKLTIIKLKKLKIIRFYLKNE